MQSVFYVGEALALVVVRSLQTSMGSMDQGRHVLASAKNTRTEKVLNVTAGRAQ